MNFGSNEYNLDKPEYSARSRDLRIRLLELYVLFVGSVLVGAMVVDRFAGDNLEQEVKTADLALAQQITEVTDTILAERERSMDDMEAWLQVLATDRSGVIVIVDAEEEIAIRQGDAAGDSSIWIGWQNRAIRTTRRGGMGSFMSNAPDRTEWLHSYVTSPASGWRVIVQRPLQTVLSATSGFHQGLLIAVGVYLLGGVVFWLALSHQVITPLERLESFSGLVRWRGRVRPGEQKQLQRLSKRHDQVGSLSRSLMAMAEDIEHRFMELSTLLETSRIVAASLDTTKVMDNILEQVVKLYHVERSAIVALDRRAGVFRIRASRQLSADYVDQLRITPSEPNSPTMRAIRNQTPVQVSDTDTDLAFADFRPRAREEGYRSVLAIPLLTQHAPPAALILYKSEPYRYSYSELEMAASFANHATIAMENAALHAQSDERLQEQTGRLEAIVESLDDCLILESLDGEVLYCNQRSVEALGLSRSQLRSKRPAELLEDLLATAINPVVARQTMETAMAGTGSRFFDLERKDPEARHQDLRIHLFDVTDAQGELMGRGQLWQDITSDKSLDRMKSTLLSTVSHELRTPLAAIKGFATTLLADDVTWDEVSQREFLQTISDETDRLTRLVKNLLDMSGIEDGTLQMFCEQYTLENIIQAAMKRIKQPFHSSRLHLNLSPDLPPVWVDLARIETVVRNLLENAAKYAPPDTPIELSAWPENGHVVVQVRDYGIGIPEPLHGKVFDRFYRVDGLHTRHVSGVGMGLAICKGFVEAHGGQVWVTDGNPGAILGFTLPVKNDSSQEDLSR